MGRSAHITLLFVRKIISIGYGSRGRCVGDVLGQAQACFYEKAVKDRARTKLKPAIIAKLAAKAGEVN